MKSSIGTRVFAAAAALSLLAPGPAFANNVASSPADSALGRPVAPALPAAPFARADLESFARALAAPAAGLTTSDLPIATEVAKDPALVDKLEDLAINGESWQRAGALYLLAESRSPRAWQVIDAAFAKNPEVAPEAFVYRNFLEEPKKGFRVWMEAAARGPPEPSAWWVESLGIFDHPDFTPDLEALLRRPDVRTAWKAPAAGLAARLGSESSANFLLRTALSQDPDSPAAIDALGEGLDRFSLLDARTKESLTQTLARLMHSGAPRERLAAAKALSRLQERLPEDLRVQAQNTLAGAWSSLGRDPKEQIPLVRALGRIGTEPVVGMIESVLRSEDFELRETAARARHQIWARRDLISPEEAKTGALDERSAVKVPAFVNGAKYFWYPGMRERLDWAIREGLIEPIGRLKLTIPRMEGGRVKGRRTATYPGNPAWAAKLRARGIDPTWYFLVPMRDPRGIERYSKIHGRSFHRRAGDVSAVFKNVGGVKLERSGKHAILFDRGGHGGGATPGNSAMNSKRLDKHFFDARDTPSAKLAASYGAGRDVFLQHVAAFYPAAIPASLDPGGRIRLLWKRGLNRLFPGVRRSNIFLYRSPAAVRTEEMGSIRDSLEAAVSWLPFFELVPAAEGPRAAAAILIERIAARKGLASYIIHQRWGVAMGYHDPSDGNQILSTHNKNPFTHFDLDTIYTPQSLRNFGESGDIEGKIQAHIRREIGWMTNDLRLLGRDLLLSSREIMRATALFYHVLLADRLAGVAPTTQPPKKDSRLIASSGH